VSSPKQEGGLRGVPPLLAVLGLALSVFLLYRTWTIPVGTDRWAIPLVNLGRALTAAGFFSLVAAFAAEVPWMSRHGFRTRPRLALAGVCALTAGYQIGRRTCQPFLEVRHVVFLLGLFTVVTLWVALVLRRLEEDDAPGAGRPPRIVPVGILALCLLLGTALALPGALFEQFEDIFITLRYGFNLASGHGITWNASDVVATEGYTSFTWVIVSAVLTALRVPAIPVLKLLSGFALLVSGILVWKCSRDLWQLDRRAALLPAACLFACPPVSYHVGTGMETLVFGTMLLAQSWLALRWSRSPE
jgi:hypothetical protein